MSNARRNIAPTTRSLCGMLLVTASLWAGGCRSTTEAPQAPAMEPPAEAPSQVTPEAVAPEVSTPEANAPDLVVSNATPVQVPADAARQQWPAVRFGPASGALVTEPAWLFKQDLDGLDADVRQEPAVRERLTTALEDAQ